MTKNYWIIFTGAAILTLLVLFLLWPDKQHDTHKDDKVDIVADHDTLKAHGVDYARANDSLIKEVIRLKDDNKKLVAGQTVTEHKLNAKSAEVRTLVAQIREINQDTGFFGHLLDSLEQQVKTLQYLIVQYEQYADSINNVNDSFQIGHDAVIKEKDKRIAELQVAYNSLYKAYMDLFKTTADLAKDLRRQRLKTKIAAVLGAAAGVIAIIK
jgi:DNA repair exonuclease SbcCD ATPase subunit